MSDFDVTGALNVLYEKLCAAEQEIAALKERVLANEKVLMEDLIGGIQELHGEGERSLRIKGITEKYGEKLSPFKDFYADYAGGSDLFEDLDKHMEAMRSGEGYDEEGIVNSVIDEMQAKLEKLKQYHAAHEKVEKQEEAPEPPPAEIEKELASEKPKEDEGKGGKRRPMRSFWDET